MRKDHSSLPGAEKVGQGRALGSRLEDRHTSSIIPLETLDSVLGTAPRPQEASSLCVAKFSYGLNVEVICRTEFD